LNLLEIQLTYFRAFLAEKGWNFSVALTARFFSFLFAYNRDLFLTNEAASALIL
jgi:hypothetical protein